MAIGIGIIASLFFASTFILNRAMDLSGGHWIWSAVLRYLFTIPFLTVIVAMRGNLRPVMNSLKAQPGTWLGWSTVGFGLFYAPLCFAAAYGPAWLVAGTWQITIIAGMLLEPRKIPRRELITSLFILTGIIMIQIQPAASGEAGQLLAGFVPVLVTAFAYPLGNRKMMAVCRGRLDVFQRVLGMSLASLPFWFLLSIFGLATAGLPGTGQVAQSLLVAILSGIVATVLFFYATDLARNDARQLAAVEATQSGEVIFTILGETMLLGTPLPLGLSLLGSVIVVLGMIIHSIRL